MSIAISTPVNSFIQFGTQPTDACADTLGLCLQVNNFSDLQFQISIPSTNPQPSDSDFYLKLADGECNEIDLQVANFTWYLSADGTRWIGVIQSWTNFAAALAGGYLQAGKCFSFSLNGIASYTDINTWTLPGNIFPIFPNTVSTDDLEINVAFGSDAPIWNSLSDFISWLNTNYAAMGTWTSSGLQIILTSTSHYPTGKLNITTQPYNSYSWDFSTVDFPLTNPAFTFVSSPGPITYTPPAGTYTNLASLLSSFATLPFGTWSVSGNNLVLKSIAPRTLGNIDVSEGEDSQLAVETTDYIEGGEYSLAVVYSDTGTNEKKGCSNCFIYTPDTCYTTLVKYRCNENAFGFDYNDDMDYGDSLSGFYNQVRLSMYLKNPQTLSKKTVYRQSDGTYQKLSAIMEKEYPCEVDWLSDDWHTKIAIALEHDDVQFYNDAIQVWESIIFDDTETYVVNWAHNDRGTNFALAPADFKIKKMPFANFNSNCD